MVFFAFHHYLASKFRPSFSKFLRNLIMISICEKVKLQQLRKAKYATLASLLHIFKKKVAKKTQGGEVQPKCDVPHSKFCCAPLPFFCNSIIAPLYHMSIRYYYSKQQENNIQKRQLYYYTQSIIIPLSCQHGLLVPKYL